ncbi:alpha/beta fold hydrolase [Nocardiopsis salina]|uniref:alpha/beta fold hydrolase n=1 Tax=Nocardiopsis salina TaxID=245836 RepID=UPI00034532FC|nr:alpha/beta fold hydrolase [Nocardiopsis salina]
MAYYTTGNPHARPTLALHGGPGSGATPGYAHFLDTTRHHLIQYDQRGCGNSTPDAAHPHTDLTTNTTTHLIDDIETLRTHLGIDTWHLLGASWGTTLALAYAQTHPHRVRALTLISVTTTSPHEIHWLTHQMRHVFPEAWQHFRDAAGPEADPHHLAHAYAQLLHDPDPTTRDRAARAWCTWEDTHVATHPHHRPNPRYQDPTTATASPAWSPTTGPTTPSSSTTSSSTTPTASTAPPAPSSTDAWTSPHPPPPPTPSPEPGPTPP